MVTLALAGERCAVDGPELVMESLRRRFAAFVVEAAPTCRLRVEVVPGFAADYAAPAELTVRRDGDRLLFSGAASGEASLSSGEGTLAGVADLGPIDAALRALVATRAPLRGWLLMHGAVFAGEQARVLLGASGTGKSTAARALDAASDEIVALRWDGAGFTACSTPYWGARAVEAPLATVAILERGSASPRVDALGGAEALRALAPHWVRYVDEPLVDRAALVLLGHLAASGPWRLALPVGESFLPALTAALERIEAAA